MKDYEKFIKWLVKKDISENLAVWVSYGEDQDDDNYTVYDLVESNVDEILEEIKAVEVAWLVFEERSYSVAIGTVMVLPWEEDCIGDWTVNLPQPIQDLLEDLT